MLADSSAWNKRARPAPARRQRPPNPPLPRSRREQAPAAHRGLLPGGRAGPGPARLVGARPGSARRRRRTRTRPAAGARRPRRSPPASRVVPPHVQQVGGRAGSAAATPGRGGGNRRGGLRTTCALARSARPAGGRPAGHSGKAAGRPRPGPPRPPPLRPSGPRAACAPGTGEGSRGHRDAGSPARQAAARRRRRRNRAEGTAGIRAGREQRRRPGAEPYLSGSRRGPGRHFVSFSPPESGERVRACNYSGRGRETPRRHRRRRPRLTQLPE